MQKISKYKILHLLVCLLLMVPALSVGAEETPAPPEAAGYKKITGAAVYSLALASDGTVWSWGNNDYGQLGTAPGPAAMLPRKVASLEGIVDVAAGDTFAVALASGGQVYFWGAMDRYDSTLPRTEDGPVAVAELTNITAVTAGNQWAAALTADGRVITWGENQFGALGRGDAVVKSAVPGYVEESEGVELTGVTAIASGYSHMIALKSDGSVWTWGLNDNGQLGTGTAGVVAKRPQMVIPGGITRIFGSSVNGVASFAANETELYAWGKNVYGSLGIDEPYFGNLTVPTLVPEVAGAKQVVNFSGDFSQETTYMVTASGAVVSFGAFDGYEPDVPVTFGAAPGRVYAILPDGSAEATGINQVGSYFGLAVPNFARISEYFGFTEMPRLQNEYDAGPKPIYEANVRIHRQNRFDLSARVPAMSDIAAVKFQILKMNGEEITSADGTFSIYSNEVFAPAFTDYILPGGTYKIAATSIASTGEQSETLILDNNGAGYYIPEADAVAKVQVYIQTASGSKVKAGPGIGVQLSGFAMAEYMNEMTDADGTVTFPAVVPQPVTVRVTSEAYGSRWIAGDLASGVNQLSLTLSDNPLEPNQLALMDTGTAAGSFEGYVSFYPPGSQAGITEYRLYWLDASKTRLDAVPSGADEIKDPFYTIAADPEEYHYVERIGPIGIPAGAVYAALVTAGTEGETETNAVEPFIDTPAGGPRNIRFQDADPRAVYLDSSVAFDRAADESNIVNYVIGVPFNGADRNGFNVIARQAADGSDSYSVALPFNRLDSRGLPRELMIGIETGSGAVDPVLTYFDETELDIVTRTNMQRFALADNRTQASVPRLTFTEDVDKPDHAAFLPDGQGDGTGATIGGILTIEGDSYAGYDVYFLGATGDIVKPLVRVPGALDGMIFPDSVPAASVSPIGVSQDGETVKLFIPPGTPIPEDAAMLGVYTIADPDANELSAEAFRIGFDGSDPDEVEPELTGLSAEGYPVTRETDSAFRVNVPQGTGSLSITPALQGNTGWRVGGETATGPSHTLLLDASSPTTETTITVFNTVKTKSYVLRVVQTPLPVIAALDAGVVDGMTLKFVRGGVTAGELIADIAASIDASAAGTSVAVRNGGAAVPVTEPVADGHLVVLTSATGSDVTYTVKTLRSELTAQDHNVSIDDVIAFIRDNPGADRKIIRWALAEIGRNPVTAG